MVVILHKIYNDILTPVNILDHLVDNSSRVNLILTSCGLVSPSTLYASSMSTSSTLASFMIGHNVAITTYIHLVQQHNHNDQKKGYHCPNLQFLTEELLDKTYNMGRPFKPAMIQIKNQNTTQNCH